MRGRRTLSVGLGLVVGGLALVAAGCIAPPPPAAPASLSVSPSTLQFGSLGPPYNPMPQIQVTVTNTGGHTATNVVVHSVDVYSVPSGTCNPTATLGPGQSCTAEIQFCPSWPGTHNFTLSVTGTDTGSGGSVAATAQLNGTAS